MAFILKDGQKVTLVLEINDAEGNPASTDEAPVWAVDGVDEDGDDLVTLEVNPDNAFEAVVTTVEGPGVGTAVVTATVDADLGEGVVSVEGVLDVEVVAGDAAVVNIVAGTPEDR